MKKKGGFIFLLLVLALCFSGCTKSETPQDEKTKHTEDNITKIYYLATNEGGVIIPAIELNEKDKEFFFSYDALSSHLQHGSYEVVDGFLYAITDDGDYQYLFEVVDEDTLKFKQRGSADISLIDYRIGINVTDQAIFKYEN